MKLVVPVMAGLFMLGTSGCAELKEVGTVIGHTTRDATKAIGHASRDAVNSIKEDMSDEE